ncbi:DUF1883 domain-containing protein [Thalassospira sp. CH_XMU1458]|uniref:DUF1883 domain-containing protein n=1 Tax=Thalassospira sp. CH_XMU1458 TaxID=3107776 RepID=UPI00300C2D44
MQLKYHDLSYCYANDNVEVCLSAAANVRLLDSNNFSKYRRGQRYQFHGGLARQSPVVLSIPNSGHWYVVVDMQGLRGSARYSVRKL